jgi:hypothetical protein
VRLITQRSFLVGASGIVLGLALIAACSSDTPPGPSSSSGASGNSTSSGGSGLPNLDSGATSTSSSGGPRARELPCDVQKVVDDHCVKCHADTPRFGAPFSLETWEDLNVSIRLGIARAKADLKPMPPAPNARLTDAEIAVLEAWESAGKPKGQCITQPSDAGADAKSDGTVTPQSCGTKLVPRSKYLMPQDKTDQYVCYGVTLSEPAKKHIVEMRPIVDNSKILHHMIVLESPTAVSPTPQACNGGMASTMRMVYAWAPGGAPVVMPPEAGFPLEGTKHYMVQLHLNNVQGLTGEQDASGMEMCTTSQLRPNDADILAFGTQKFTIPGNGGSLTKNCTFKVPNGLGPFNFFVSMPHMHEIGKSIATTLEPKAGGAPIDLGAVPNWDFGTQYWLPINAVGKAGDTIRTTCSWTNPNSFNVSYGEDTKDEMCYSFTMYYPRVQGLSSWAIPAATSQCN